MRTLSPKAEKKFVSTAMRLEMKGIKKVAFSMLKKGLDDKLIMEVTGLTQKQLDYLKALKEFKIELDYNT